MVGSPIKAFIGFDFYGAGNIGDDLMLEGFMSAFKSDDRFSFTCSLPADRLETQRRRFPQVQWLQAEGNSRQRLIQESDVWLGVGGTPFQASSGQWLLKRTLRDFDASPNIPKLMVGVGAEGEVREEHEKAATVLNQVSHIWTRDAGSQKVLADQFKPGPDKISVGGDLANIALRSMFAQSAQHSDHGHKVGLVLFKDNSADIDIGNLRRAVERVAEHHPVVWIANDVRRNKLDHALYKRTFSPLRRFIQKYKIGFHAPDYDAANAHEMIEHFKDYSIVVSSRYHALLTAAWTGARVAALARSSKLKFLAEELDVPLVEFEPTPGFLAEAVSTAKPVMKSHLSECALRTEKMIEDLKQTLLKSGKA